MLQSVCVGINHTWVGDLKVNLIAPNGANIALVDRPGFTGTGFGCSNNNISACFVPGTGNEVEGVCVTSPPALYAISGNNYTAFNGANLNSINTAGGSGNGNWQLVVSDNAGSDTGSIVSWSLNFVEITRPTTTVQTGGPASGASFPVGTTTNTFQATDAAGNTSTCSFTVTVADVEVP